MQMIDYGGKSLTAEVRVASIITSLSDEFPDLEIFHSPRKVQVGRRGLNGGFTIADFSIHGIKVADDDRVANAVAFLNNLGNEPRKGGGMPMVEYTFNPHAAEIRIAEIIVSLSKEFRDLEVFRQGHTVDVGRRARNGWVVIADSSAGYMKVIDDEALANGIAFLKSRQPGRRGDKPTKGDNMAMDDCIHPNRVEQPQRMVPRGPFDDRQADQPEQHRRMTPGVSGARQEVDRKPSELDKIEACVQDLLNGTAIALHRLDGAANRLGPDPREQGPQNETAGVSPNPPRALDRLRDHLIRHQKLNAQLNHVANRLDELV